MYTCEYLHHMCLSVQQLALCSTWVPAPGHMKFQSPLASPIAHRHTHRQIHGYIERGHQWLTRSPLTPLVPSSLHGFPQRNTSTSDPQATSPASLAQYLLKLTYLLMYLYFLTRLHFLQLLAPPTPGPLRLDPTAAVGA